MEAYLRTMELHIDTLSESRNFIDAMDEFRAAFAELGRRGVDEGTRGKVEVFFRDKPASAGEGDARELPG